MAAASIPSIPWAELPSAMRWRQGEHVTLIGPTGCGKSTLAIGLLPLRRYVLFLATKPRDRTIDRLRKQGYRVIRSADEWPPPMIGGRPAYERVVFWPQLRDPSDVRTQRDAIRHVMASVFRTGGWCVVADELRYVTQYLGLQHEAELYWLQGRSLGISFVTASQRPAWVPLEAFSQATHLMMWGASDDRDLKRLSDIGNADVRAIRDTLPELGKHEFLYVNARTGAIARSVYQP